ncbi:VOC family protein [Caldimonas thermodepolymerans]|uniref:Glyoxalase n=1 Tax=Caldimonas thermodepolymerans TaxID=215580 RepID=A0A2S5T016_9BURK|nr:VOC family protein [Caldimonas thermodepolymerans]PPE68249.1 glyoxalase [Caldimonas thermodepolymerans]QPC30887.1 VOC family protein [Caldimonas thermodepolymerans]RDH97110.1 putative glyoxalase superfamily protein PhnB [Caldimonas thermodepolymerans]
MHPTAKDTRCTVIPCLRYRDAPAAIDWLCQVFGFERHLVVPDDHGGIAHAQLAFGNGMVMVASADHESEYGDLVNLPDQVGGVETQSPYLIVQDADAVHARAQAAGAQIVIPLRDEPYGGRGFTCRDLEGRLWSVGTYDPWTTP